MIISMIAALAINRIIGVNNTIPWYISADMKWFKQHTLNKSVIMGRKTFESLTQPLPNRRNIVLSHNPGNDNRVKWVTTPDEALRAAGQVEEIMIIGGSQVYKTFLLQSKRLYLTHINLYIADDRIKFPLYDLKEWRLVFRAEYNTDIHNLYNYRFEILERR